MTFEDAGIVIPFGQSGRFRMVCPQCSSERKKANAKDLTVDIDKGVWHCHHCLWGGGLNQREPHVYISKAFKRPTWPDDLDRPRVITEWLKARGLSDSTLDTLCVTGALMPMRGADYVNTDVIFFPYYKDGHHINSKFRMLGAKDFRLEEGAELTFYNIDSITEASVIITEGEIDALSAIEAGYTSVISVPNGAPPEGAKDLTKHLAYLTDCIDRFNGTREIILALDNDGPGNALKEELARRFGPERCSSISYPQGCKDLNEVLVMGGTKGVRDCIENRTLWPIWGVRTANEVSGEVEDLYLSGAQGGTSTGWSTLDLHYTVAAGELTIVTGIPGSGKSYWLDALTVNIARNEGWVFGMYSPEQHPIRLHISRLIEKYTRESFRSWNGGKHAVMTAERMREGLAWVNDHYWFLGQVDESQGVTALVTQAKQLVKRGGIRGLIIDPWGDADHSDKGEKRDDEYISLCLTQLRAFARLYQCHVWVVAHTTKLVKDKKGNYPVPDGYMISGGGMWLNKADNLICIWKPGEPELKDHCVVYVQKIRNRENSSHGLGETTLLWQGKDIMAATKSTATTNQNFSVLHRGVIANGWRPGKPLRKRQRICRKIRRFFGVPSRCWIH